MGLDLGLWVFESAIRNPNSALLGLGFANVSMLAGMAAASIPIIIHLLNKRKFREERWAAMRFLLAAIRKNQRRIRLEQWLLLAVRTLLVMLVVAAMAKPFLESFIPVLAGRRTHRVLVLDGSLSMGNKAGEANRFEQAKDLAAKLVKDARQGDAVSVVLMGEPPRVVIGAPSPNHAEVLKELSEVTLPHGATDLVASLTAIDRVLEASTIPQKEVVILTDLQATSWRKGVPDQALKRVLARLEARRSRTVVIDLGENGGDNRAVTDLKMSTPIVTVGMSPPPMVTATVRNFGRSPVEGLRVRLMIDGRVGPEQTVSLAAGEEKAVLFNGVAFPDAGESLVEVQIDDDVLPLDNRRGVAVPVREALKVLLVDGDPKTEPFRSETDFLSAALDPGPDPETDSPGSPPTIQVRVVPESQLSGDLSANDAVVLCNLARFTAPEVAAIEAYLKQGGGVVIFGGDQVQADNYNNLLFDRGKGLLPAQVGQAVGDPDAPGGQFEFNPLGFKHPIVAEFVGQSPGVTAGLTKVKTARYTKLKLPDDSPAQVALAFDSGDPAVIEAPRHRGRVIQVATSADNGWTTWPLHQSYPAVMQQIIWQAASGRMAERNLRVGQPLDLALPLGGAELIATITRPDRKTARPKVAAAGEVSRLHYEDTDLSGSYQVKVPPPLNVPALFVANPDPSESDPAKLDRTGLADALPGWGFDYRNDISTLFDNAASVSQRGELHRPLLWGVLALLMVEAVLAWWFGHHR